MTSSARDNIKRTHYDEHQRKLKQEKFHPTEFAVFSENFIKLNLTSSVSNKQ